MTESAMDYAGDERDLPCSSFFIMKKDYRRRDGLTPRRANYTVKPTVVDGAFKSDDFLLDSRGPACRASFENFSARPNFMITFICWLHEEPLIVEKSRRLDAEPDWAASLVRR